MSALLYVQLLWSTCEWSLLTPPISFTFHTFIKSSNFPIKKPTHSKKMTLDEDAPVCIAVHSRSIIVIYL